MRSSLLPRLVSGALLASLSMSVFAQDIPENLTLPVPADPQITAQPTQVETETVTLVVGDILEILPSTSIQNPSYSWILTQNRTFIQAGRSETFRYRFIQPGTYSLNAEIQTADQQQTISRSFTIIAKARTIGTAGTGISSAAASGSDLLTGLVKTEPAMDANKRVILQDAEQLIKLSAINPDIKPLSLDINTSVDSDNDGNPSNDVDNKNTFFQLYAEPLYIWFAEPVTQRTMSVTTVKDGAAVVQTIDVASFAYAQQQGVVVSPIDIDMQSTGNGSYTFNATFTNGAAPTAPLLYHWTFGDTQESLIMNPTHTYGADGSYTVHLQVRNLIDGQDIANVDKTVTVQGITSPVSSASSASTTENTSSSSSGFSLMNVLMLLGVFVFFLLLGLGAVILFSRMRGGKSLDQTFADMEKTIVGNESTEAKPAPLAIPATAAVTATKPQPTQDDIAKREENAVATPSAETPRIDEKAAPGWLKKGLETKAPSTPATPTPVATEPIPSPAATPKPAPVPPEPIPEPKPVIAPVASAPAPAPTPKPTPAAPSDNTAPAPSWLKPQPAAAPAPTSTPKPTPAPTPAPVVATPGVTPTPVAPKAPAPATPEPILNPTPAPKPVTPPVPPAPIATPEKPVTPPTPAPVAAPKPQTPIVETPKPVAPIETPKPVTAPVPAPQQPKPAVPTTTPEPKPQMPFAEKPVTSPLPETPKPEQPKVVPPVAVPTPTPAPSPTPKPIVPPAAPQVSIPKPPTNTEKSTVNPDLRSPVSDLPNQNPSPKPAPTRTVLRSPSVAQKGQPTPKPITPAPQQPKPILPVSNTPTSAPISKPIPQVINNSAPASQPLAQTTPEKTTSTPDLRSPISDLPPETPIAIIRAESIESQQKDQNA